MTGPAQLVDLIQRAAAEAGFERAGIAALGRDYQELGYFPEWIASGHAGDMEYMKSRDPAGHLKRASVASVAPWARSVIVCALNYNADRPYSTHFSNPRHGWISRYAWGGREKPVDYHDAVLRRLRAVEARLRERVSGGLQTRCYVDTGPVVERVYAKYAGVGWIGKNTCLINQRLGSWLFLGVILTSLELQPGTPAPDRCGTCTRCIDACPTHAIVAPYQLDSRRCIAYLTIEKRGPIPEELRPGIGRQVFGCDICQDVCPWNRKAPTSAAGELHPADELVNPALDWLAAMSEEEFRRRFRGSPVRRAKYSGFRRNLAVAMGNSGQPAFLPRLREMATGPDPLVAEHARWALRRINREDTL